MVYVLAFAASIFCNLKALEGSNIETVIVFRSCTPLAVSLLDFAVLGREMPSWRSFLSLLLILVGAAGYVLTDRAFLVDGISAYGWVAMYFLLLCFQMTYGKQLLDAVHLKSTWGPVLYSNVLSIVPTLLLGAVLGDFQRLDRLTFSPNATVIGLVSCVIGIGIGFTGWHCRGMISATSYTLVGVINKLATVLISALIWESTASWLGIVCLLLTIIGGSLYQQAPMRRL